MPRLVRAMVFLAAVIAVSGCGDITSTDVRVTTEPPTVGTSVTRPKTASEQTVEPGVDSTASSSTSATLPAPPLPEADGITLEEAVADSLILTEYSVRVRGPGTANAQLRAGPVTLSFVVANLGEQPDVYTITALGPPDYADLSEVPSRLSLEPGEEETISVEVRIPERAEVGDVAVIRINATSTQSPPIQDESDVVITVEG